MKNLLLIRGVSGSGKSTFAKMLGGKNYEVDHFFYENGKYNFNPDRLKEAHEWCRNKVENEMLLENPFIIVSNTFTDPWEMEVYFNLAEEFGYKVTTIIMENRHGNSSVHNVPEKTLKRQKEKLKNSIRL